jgi:creatinine amidohydrolase
MSAGSQLLLGRCAAAPAMLKAMLRPESSGAAPERADLQLAQTLDPRLPFVITGIGTSEGPARLLAHLLIEHAGAAACFVPLSVFAGAMLGEPVGGAAVLVVFSQGLSPNAQLALTQSARFAAVVVYTSVAATDARVVALRARGVTVAVLPPGGAAVGSATGVEDQLFLRVLGPAAAQLAAAQLAAAVAERRGQAARLPIAAAVAAAASAQSRTQAALLQLGSELVQRGLLTTAAFDAYGLGALWQAQPQLPLALVTSGGYGELCLGLRWKFLEGAGLSQPVAWDVLQVAHGPLQQTFHQPLLWCALSRGNSPIEQALLVRLQAMLPAHHVLLHLPAELTGPLALFEHDLACNELVLAIRRGRDWNLLDWPGRLSDGPLYTLADRTELA